MQVRAEKPERASETAPVTVTGVAEKTAPSAGDVTLSAGRVLSIFRVTLAVKLPLEPAIVPVMT